MDDRHSTPPASGKPGRRPPAPSGRAATDRLDGGAAAGDGESALDPSPGVGSIIDDRYRLEEELGTGGMGVVYRAHHLALERDVAVKFVRPDLQREPVVADRFIREAKSASRLDHPHCIRVNDFGETADGHRYLVMELLRGRELRELVGAPWRPKRAVDLMMQVFEGLSHAHGHAVVHRDLKPANVLITTDHRGDPMAKIVDFGIARMVDMPLPSPTGGPTGSGRAGPGLGTSGNFGTPRYMSPEQAAGKQVDARTDLYSAGVILYELLAGRPPFDAPEGQEVVRMQMEATPAPLPKTVPKSLRKLVRHLLAKRREDRIGSAREALEELRVIYQEIAATPETVSPAGHTPVAALPLAAGKFGPGEMALDATGRYTPTGPMPAVAREAQRADSDDGDDDDDDDGPEDDGIDAGTSMVGSQTLPPGMMVRSPFAPGGPRDPARHGHSGEPPPVKWAEGEATLLSVPVPGEAAGVDPRAHTAPPVVPSSATGGMSRATKVALVCGGAAAVALAVILAVVFS